MGSLNLVEIQYVVIENPNASEGKTIDKKLSHLKRTLEDNDSIDSMCMSKFNVL